MSIHAICMSWYLLQLVILCLHRFCLRRTNQLEPWTKNCNMTTWMKSLNDRNTMLYKSMSSGVDHPSHKVVGASTSISTESLPFAQDISFTEFSSPICWACVCCTWLFCVNFWYPKYPSSKKTNTPSSSRARLTRSYSVSASPQSFAVYCKVQQFGHPSPRTKTAYPWHLGFNWPKVKIPGNKNEEHIMSNRS